MAAEPTEGYVVFPDLHGQYELAARALDRYDLDEVTAVFLGDVLDDGPDSAGLLGLIREVESEKDGVVLVGNHEWVCRNALTLEDPRAEDWRELIWPEYEDGTLQSYDVDSRGNWRENAQLLARRMRSTGDLDFLQNRLCPSFETETFIAMHGGPIPDQPWERQRADLENASTPGERLSHEPEQIFSGRLARPVPVSKRVDGRVFVTGHAHFHASAAERRVGNRICLASNLSAGQPLYVWESGPDRIVEISIP